MTGAIPWALVIALTQTECVSEIDSRLSITVVHQCPMPQVQGPKRPYWWWSIDLDRDVEPPKVKQITVEPAKPIKKKKKPKKRKKRR